MQAASVAATALLSLLAAPVHAAEMEALISASAVRPVRAITLVEVERPATPATVATEVTRPGTLTPRISPRPLAQAALAAAAAVAAEATTLLM